VLVKIKRHTQLNCVECPKAARSGMSVDQPLGISKMGNQETNCLESSLSNIAKKSSCEL
jgi:hypothetical protein